MWNFEGTKLSDLLKKRLSIYIAALRILNCCNFFGHITESTVWFTECVYMCNWMYIASYIACARLSCIM